MPELLDDDEERGADDLGDMPQTGHEALSGQEGGGGLRSSVKRIITLVLLIFGGGLMLVTILCPQCFDVGNPRALRDYVFPWESMVTALLVGALLGWIASLMEVDSEQGPLMYIIIGIVGSVLGKVIFADLFHLGGPPDPDAISRWRLNRTLACDVFGAVSVLALLKKTNVLR